MYWWWLGMLFISFMPLPIMCKHLKFYCCQSVYSYISLHGLIWNLVCSFLYLVYNLYEWHISTACSKAKKHLCHTNPLLPYFQFQQQVSIMTASREKKSGSTERAALVCRMDSGAISPSLPSRERTNNKLFKDRGKDKDPTSKVPYKPVTRWSYLDIVHLI